jgi:hypothetical protein
MDDLFDLLFTKAGAAFSLLLLGVLFLLGWQMEFGTQHHVTFTVQSLDDQATSKGHKYLIFTTDGRVFENSDAWLHGKTDSSNVWGMFLAHPHGTYDCPVYGYRNTLFSSYQDVLDGCRLLHA